jgi:hypothetical protein
MNQEITTITVRTTVRKLELTSDQVKHIVRHWAQREHGFGETIIVDSWCLRDGIFDSMTLTETNSETTEE